jgi:hypothetical protein
MVALSGSAPVTAAQAYAVAQAAPVASNPSAADRTTQQDTVTISAQDQQMAHAASSDGDADAS